MMPDKQRAALLADLAPRLIGATVTKVYHMPGALPGDPPALALKLALAGFDPPALVLVLFADEEGNPGGALHVVDATHGTYRGILS